MSTQHAIEAILKELYSLLYIDLSINASKQFINEQTLKGVKSELILRIILA